jgi:hypothetical protein
MGMRALRHHRQFAPRTRPPRTRCALDVLPVKIAPVIDELSCSASPILIRGRVKSIRGGVKNALRPSTVRNSAAHSEKKIQQIPPKGHPNRTHCL